MTAALVIEIFLVGVGLSMDAFAVSICKGLAMDKLNRRQMFVIGLYFGGFQALMPLLGWSLGSSFAGYIQAVDHWIAFVLLGIIGGKMVWEAIHEKEEDIEIGKKPLDHRELFMLAVATSIDAFAIGITFAFLERPILPCIGIIGFTTLVLSMVGVVIGNFFGTRFKKKAEILGGVILIGIGLKILLEHLDILVI